MVAAVFGVRYGLRALGLSSPVASLAVEILAGAIVYVGSAFVFARTAALDFLGIVMQMLRRRRAAA
jgi:PST family polysaccharide transporter